MRIVRCSGRLGRGCLPAGGVYTSSCEQNLYLYLSATSFADGNKHVVLEVISPSFTVHLRRQGNIIKCFPLKCDSRQVLTNAHQHCVAPHLIKSVFKGQVKCINSNLLSPNLSVGGGGVGWVGR